MTSKAQKNAGFLLPAVIDPQQAICVEFQIPDTPEYRAAVRGHVEQLGKHWVWEKSNLPGDNRAGDASRLFMNSIFHTFKFDNDCLKCETPFWYDADTVDDDECCDDEDEDCHESEDQNQWLEDAADWIITAFIAATLTPGAAIAYKTVIPRMRLFFRTGDLGAIANIFVDGILWGAVNTALAGAPELITTIIDLDDFRAIHELGPENIIRIVHDVPAAAAALPGGEFSAMSEPEYKLEVVRGDIRAPVLCDAFTEKPTYQELNQAYYDCYGEDIPQMFDVRVQGCLLQKTTDGGETWTTVQDLTECAPPPEPITFQQVDCTLEANSVVIFDASCATPEPDDDPGMPEAPVNGIGTDKLCDFATYMTEIVLPTQLQELITLKDTATSQNELVVALLVMPAAIVAAVVTGGVAVAAWVSAAAAGAAAGAAGVSIYNAMEYMDTTLTDGEATPQFWLDVRCIIYCTMPIDGRLTKAAATEIADKILEDLEVTYPNAAPVIASMFYSWSPEARAQITSTGAHWEGSGCGTCDCDTPWTWSFTAPVGDPIDCRPSKYITLEHGAWRNDFSEIETELLEVCSSQATAIIDLREHDTEIYQIQVLSPAYPTSSGCGFPPRNRIIEAFNESTGQWYDVYRGFNFQFGGVQAIDPTTRMLRITINGHAGPGTAEYMYALSIWGRRENPMELECDAINIDE